MLGRAEMFDPTYMTVIRFARRYQTVSPAWRFLRMVAARTPNRMWPVQLMKEIRPPMNRLRRERVAAESTNVATHAFDTLSTRRPGEDRDEENGTLLNVPEH